MRWEEGHAQTCCSAEVTEENTVVVFVGDFADDFSCKRMGFYKDAACAGHHAAEGCKS